MTTHRTVLLASTLLLAAALPSSATARDSGSRDCNSTGIQTVANVKATGASCSAALKVVDPLAQLHAKDDVKVTDPASGITAETYAAAGGWRCVASYKDTNHVSVGSGKCLASGGRKITWSLVDPSVGV